jgi:hypothetical protein
MSLSGSGSSSYPRLIGCSDIKLSRRKSSFESRIVTDTQACSEDLLIWRTTSVRPFSLFESDNMFCFRVFDQRMRRMVSNEIENSVLIEVEANSSEK